MSTSGTPRAAGMRPRLTPAMADVRRAVREWGETAAPGLYLVGLSGGGDSLALAWAAGIEGSAVGIRVGAVIIDHQLQPDSPAVAERAADQARQFGLDPVIVQTVTPDTVGGPENAARRARYQAYRDVMAQVKATGVLLAHTEDDQAETVLMGLSRGSGPSSMKGMAAADPPYWRPLLSLPRAALRAALEDAGVAWWEDPHNHDERFLRVRVRHQVMPVIEEQLGPGVAPALARTAALFRQDSDYLDEVAARLGRETITLESPSRVSIAVSTLADTHDALATRLLRQMTALVQAPPPTLSQMRQMIALVRAWRGQSAVAIGGASVERSGESIVVSATTATKGVGA